MRYAIISDVHANIEALNSFFEDIKENPVDKIVCLGDLVGYNANPNECVDLIREKKIPCVMGNHDSMAAGVEDLSEFNLLAADAITWTRGVLTEQNKTYLAALPRSLAVDKSFYAVHGSINHTNSYIYGAADALRNFKLLQKVKGLNICFFGHTHVPISYLGKNDSVRMNLDNTVKLKKGASYLINPGGLGQSRDKDPRGSYAVYDSKKLEVAFHRVEYDIEATVEKIVEAGLSPRLAERLKLGW
ncbi:MAG: metallophosphoesterase family protein [Thermodesulfobacteriota bacterium]